VGGAAAPQLLNKSRPWVVMNKCFLNLEKKAQIRLAVSNKNAPFILKNDVTEPKARRLGYLFTC